MSVDLIITLISNLGVPVAFSVYFMVKLDKVIENNTKAMVLVYEVVSKCKKVQRR